MTSRHNVFVSQIIYARYDVQYTILIALLRVRPPIDHNDWECKLRSGRVESANADGQTIADRVCRCFVSRYLSGK